MRNKMTNLINKFKEIKMADIDDIKAAVLSATSKISSEAVGWISVLVLHAATIPTLLAVMSGLTDRMPPVDLVLMIWTALTLLFVKAAVQKDMLNIITIALGFVVQAVLMALIFFK
jgi:hypothetical protein